MKDLIAAIKKFVNVEDERDARVKAREVALTGLRHALADVQHALAEVNRYRKVLSLTLDDARPGEKATVPVLSWYCGSRAEECVMREMMVQYTIPVDLAALINHPEQLAPPCPYCGRLAILKRQDRTVPVETTTPESPSGGIGFWGWRID